MLLLIMLIMTIYLTTIDSYRLINRNFNKLSYKTITTTTVNTNHIRYNHLNPTAYVITIPRRINILKSSILDDIEDEEELVSFRNIASSYLKSKFSDCYGNCFLCYNLHNYDNDDDD